MSKNSPQSPYPKTACDCSKMGSSTDDRGRPVILGHCCGRPFTRIENKPICKSDICPELEMDNEWHNPHNNREQNNCSVLILCDPSAVS